VRCGTDTGILVGANPNGLATKRLCSWQHQTLDGGTEAAAKHNDAAANPAIRQMKKQSSNATMQADSLFLVRK
jgi:hypothetical protein